MKSFEVTFRIRVNGALGAGTMTIVSAANYNVAKQLVQAQYGSNCVIHFVREV